MKTLAAPDTAPLARCHAAGSCVLAGAASDETGGSRAVVAAVAMSPMTGEELRGDEAEGRYGDGSRVGGAAVVGS